MVLHAVQEERGYIPREAHEWIAQKLGIEPIQVYEVVTFYPMFKEAPVGKKHIKVCRTLSCALQGGYKVCNAMQEELGVGLDETSADGSFTIEFVECLASCGTAPVAMVNEQMHENLTPEKARELCRRLKDELGVAEQPAGAPGAGKE